MKMSYSNVNELHYEKIGSFWGRLAVILFFASALLFAFLYFYQRVHGPLGDRPAPDGFYLLMLGVMLLVGVLVVNFFTLTIHITTEGLTAAYGIFKQRIPWDNVAGYEMGKGTALLNYGGYGIRFGYKKGGAVLVYNIMGARLIMLELRAPGRYKYFAFSTRHPEEVAAIVEKWANPD
jgi:hypothetical protein